MAIYVLKTEIELKIRGYDILSSVCVIFDTYIFMSYHEWFQRVNHHAMC